MSLKFSYGNRKMHELASLLNLKKTQVACFDLPAGWTCPAASLCKSMADRASGKITDGPKMQFRCYAASGEAIFKNARQLRWTNYEALKSLTLDGMVALIEASLPVNIKIIRIHSSGDFFNATYFKAWMQVAQNHPEINFFGYTKILTYVKAQRPENFKLVYSFGGLMDAKLDGEPTAYVVNSIEDATAQGLKVACEASPADDYFSVMASESFAVVIHGTQPAHKAG